MEPPSHAAQTLGNLLHKHMEAGRIGDESRRSRLFLLILELEWAYPEAAEEFKSWNDEKLRRAKTALKLLRGGRL